MAQGNYRPLPLLAATGHRLWRVSLRTKLIGAFSGVLLITLVLSAMALDATMEDEDASRLLTHTHGVISNIENAQAALSQVQASYRGYLLGGTDDYLSSYQDSLGQYEAILEDLRQATADNPEQIERWNTLDEQVTAWMDQVVEPGTALRQSVNQGDADLGAVQEFTRTATGVGRFNAILATLESGIEHERALLQAQQDEAGAVHDRLRFVLIVGTGIALAVGIIVTWVLTHDIGNAMAGLTQQARRMADGQLHARIDSRRKDEIGQAASAFDAMAEKLEHSVEELQTATQQSQESESHLRTIVENAGEGIIAILEDGTITTANPAAQAMFSPDGSSLVGRCFDDLIELPNDDSDRTFVDLIPSQSSPHDTVRAVDGCRTDGTTFPLEAIISEIPDGSERLFIGLVRDITDRRSAEDRLNEQVSAAERAESSTRAVLDAAGEAMILINLDATILTLNRRFSDFFGVNMEEVSGTPMALYGAQLDKTFVDADRFRHMLYKSIKDTESRITETFNQKWPVARDLELYSTFVKTERGEHLGRLYAFRDVTHQREIDRMKNEFVSLVSHELRTPLTSIKGYVDLLLDGEVGELEPDQREFLEIVGSNAQRLVNLINDLLDISRIEAGRIELSLAPVDVGPLLQRITTSFRPQLDEKHQQITVTIDPALPAITADEERLTQVFANLVSNAHKYTPAGGMIGISARADANDVIIDITDSGIGMSEEELSKLFTRFYRARNRTTQEVGGTGLGLSITRSLIELHQGSISVTSEPGEGSTFTVAIPQAVRAERADLEPASVPPSGGRILVVEDDPDIAKLIHHYLKRSGYDATIAADARTALEVARGERFDLITLDVMLPDTDGFTLLEWLKNDSETGDVPVVMLSMLPDEGTGGRLGAVDYVVKPIHERTLISRIGQVLQRNKSARILVVDDDEDIRHLIARNLGTAGYDVHEVSSGEEALALLEHNTVDLILLDVRMPGMDGVQTLGALRQRADTRSVPVLMITASPGLLDDEGTALEDLGISGLLSKSISPQEIALTIGESLATSTHREAP